MSRDLSVLGAVLRALPDESPSTMREAARALLCRAHELDGSLPTVATVEVLGGVAEVTGAWLGAGVEVIDYD